MTDTELFRLGRVSHRCLIALGFCNGNLILLPKRKEKQNKLDAAQRVNALLLLFFLIKDKYQIMNKFI